MRYDPATYVPAAPWANTGADARHQPVSSLRPGDRDGAMSGQAAELDDWEDEGGATEGYAPESPRGRGKRHFDEFSG